MTGEFIVWTYMFISIKIKLQLSLVILPQIVYDYSSPLIFNRTELKHHNNEVYGYGIEKTSTLFLWNIVVKDKN